MAVKEVAQCLILEHWSGVLVVGAMLLGREEWLEYGVCWWQIPVWLPSQRWMWVAVGWRLDLWLIFSSEVLIFLPWWELVQPQKNSRNSRHFWIENEGRRFLWKGLLVGGWHGIQAGRFVDFAGRSRGCLGFLHQIQH